MYAACFSLDCTTMSILKIYWFEREKGEGGGEGWGEGGGGRRGRGGEEGTGDGEEEWGGSGERNISLQFLKTF